MPNPDLTNMYRFVRTVQAWYGAYETTTGNWGIVAGVRGEATTAEGGAPSGANHYRQHYRGLYPNLHMERALDKVTTLSFAFGRRIARPDPEELNPYVDHQDIHNLRAGNPNLRPQETETAEAGWRQERTCGNVGLTFYLRHIHDSVTDITVPIAPDVVLSTKTNLTTSHAGGAEFSGDMALTPTLSVRASGNLAYSQIDASALGFNGTRSTTAVNLKGSLDYRPTVAHTLQLSLNRLGRRLTPQGDVAPITLVNLGFKHQLPRNLMFVSTVSDAFNGQRFARTLNTAAFQQHYQRAQLGRVAYVGVSYQFGAPKKPKSSGFDYDQ